MRKEAYRLLDCSLVKCPPALEDLVDFIWERTKEQVANESGEEVQQKPNIDIGVFKTVKLSINTISFFIERMNLRDYSS